jgi:hypothetical protein
MRRRRRQTSNRNSNTRSSNRSRWSRRTKSRIVGDVSVTRHVTRTYGMPYVLTVSTPSVIPMRNLGVVISDAYLQDNVFLRTDHLHVRSLSDGGRWPIITIRSLESLCTIYFNVQRFSDRVISVHPTSFGFTDPRFLRLIRLDRTATATATKQTLPTFVLETLLALRNTRILVSSILVVSELPSRSPCACTFVCVCVSRQ